jgi:hypothetical protein
MLELVALEQQMGGNGQLKLLVAREDHQIFN